MLDLNREIYWIGGSACAGKSTLAKRFAEENGFALYACDEHVGMHLQHITEKAQPVMYRVSRMAMNEVFFTRKIAEQLKTYIEYLREDFLYVLSDVAGGGSDPVVVEGNQLLPDLIEPLLRQKERAIWMIPSEQFQRNQYSRREWIQGILQATENPERSFENWMRRDALFADKVKREAKDRKLKVLEVDGSQTLEQNYNVLSGWLGCDIYL
ncbi:hypothetical protein NYE24_24885 [Paenibacillus sp. FSL H7-0350]|uniref:hypothetical protein n=1 Tax=unclassified Paenibacillus TaxID=185978 RepID=UPI0003E1C770|nr:hypothetical protein [Paenibacillus sp. FSL R7-269]ETT30726.1 hypothetical protein C162_32534 [Paenibacillus sp. FSL R7-269]